MSDLPDKVNKMTIKKERAVELWRETKGHISDICRSIGISRTTFYEWMKDGEFAQALIDAESELNDDVRNALIQKIADGDMTAIIYYLKNRHPDFKQKEQPNLTQNNIFNITDAQFTRITGGAEE